MSQIKTGRYRHFKGREYLVEGVAKHSETEEDYVVYRASYAPDMLWIRPVAMFLEKVKYQGQEVDRFVYIDE